MPLLTVLTNRAGCSTGNREHRSHSRLGLSVFLLAFGLTGAVQAEVIEVFNFDFETDPPNFDISTQIFPEPASATASFEYGDVGGSRGMIYKGTFQTTPGVTDFEFANGIFSPAPPTFDDFHLYPTQTNGIQSISVFMDGIVDGLPSDNENSLRNMGFFFSLWQVKDGLWDIYELIWEFDNAVWADIGRVDLTVEDFMREDGSMPDFSPTAQPISFGFAVGVGYAWESGPNGQFISTSARVDNWRVTAKVGQTVFEHGFEPVEMVAASRSSEKSAIRSCNGERCAQASSAGPRMDEKVLSAPPER